MSHDIEFAAPPGKAKEARKKLVARLKELGWRRDAHGAVLTLDDPDTGVSATLDEDEPGAYDGWESLGLYLSIPYARPYFWGLVALGRAQTVAVEVGLGIADPQSRDPGDDGAPRYRDVDSLVRSWLAGNALATSALAGDKPGLSRALCRYFWLYQSTKGAVQAALASADVFVPKLIPVVRGNERCVSLQIGWPDAIPLVLPECDYLVIGHSTGKDFQVDGVAEYRGVRSLLAPLLKPYPIEDGVDALILWPGDANGVGDRLSRLQLVPRSEFRPLPLDGFVTD